MYTEFNQASVAMRQGQIVLGATAVYWDESNHRGYINLTEMKSEFRPSEPAIIKVAVDHGSDTEIIKLHGVKLDEAVADTRVGFSYEYSDSYKVDHI